jgi:hypothetical protein
MQDVPSESQDVETGTEPGISCQRLVAPDRGPRALDDRHR